MTAPSLPLSRELWFFHPEWKLSKDRASSGSGQAPSALGHRGLAWGMCKQIDAWIYPQSSDNIELGQSLGNCSNKLLGECSVPSGLRSTELVVDLPERVNP